VLKPPPTYIERGDRVHHVCDHNSDYYYFNGHCPPNSPLVGNGLPWWGWILLVLGAIVAFIIIYQLLARTFARIYTYERGVVFRFGKLRPHEKQPGLRMMIPFVDEIVKVDMQETALTLEPQKVMTKDSVSLTILAVAFFQVQNASDAETKVYDYISAIQQRAQSIMRRLVGQQELQQILEHNQELVELIEKELESATTEWGIEIKKLEMKDLTLPESMERAMSAVAESQRDAHAKVIAADGELQAADKLEQAGKKLGPNAMRLRELQTMTAIGADNATVIVVPSNGQITGEAAAGAFAAGANGA
jgi:regulator of protease activity HflC (stomatin/prohibitin superfamily)